MTGVNWFGAETGNYSPHGLWSRNYKDMLDQMASLGYNTLRLPYSNQLFDPGVKPNSIDAVAEPGPARACPACRCSTRSSAYAGTKGMRVILDQHRPDSGAQSPLWYTSAYPESRWLSDWTMLAQHYKGNTTVIGADLHNEPHSSRVAAARAGAAATPRPTGGWPPNAAGNAVLAANPDWLVIVEGVDCVSGTGDPQCGWWGGNLSGARQFPVRLSKPDKLVYSAHEYATSVFAQPWFSDPSFPANLPALWDHFFGYLQKQNIAPVLLGEFGTTLADPRDKTWLQELMKYAGTGADRDELHVLVVEPQLGRHRRHPQRRLDHGQPGQAGDPAAVPDSAGGLGRRHDRSAARGELRGHLPRRQRVAGRLRRHGDAEEHRQLGR